MKTVELPDSVFEMLETLRRSKRMSRAAVLEEAIKELYTQKLLTWWENRKPTPKAAMLTEEEADQMAIDAVREERQRRTRLRKRLEAMGQKLVTRLEDIPTSFDSEEDEAEWWETHELTPDLLLSLPEPSEEELRERFSKERATVSERSLITRKEDIPESFASEDAEVEFWETHTLSSELFYELQRDMAEDNVSRMLLSERNMPERILITREEDIPDFDKMSCDEEADWWDTHDIAEHLWDNTPEGIEQARIETYAALGIPDPAERKKKC